MSITYVTGWVACIKRQDDSRFPNGRYYLYSSPFPTEQMARNWAEAFDGCELLRVEKNKVPKERLARYES